MELIKSKDSIINQNGARIVPFIMDPAMDSFSAVEVSVDVTGHGMVKSTHADRVIRVIEGAGTVVIGSSRLEAQSGSMYAVPKDTFYDYFAVAGTLLTVLVVDVPKFDAAFEVGMQE